MWKKKQEEGKQKISDLVLRLKGICSDQHYATSLIDEILSLKGQLSIVPTELYVPLDEVLEEYDFGHFKLLDTLKGVIIKTTGYCIYVEMRIQSLYGQVKALMEYKKRYDTLTEEERSNYDMLLAGTMVILLNPLVCFSDDDYWINQTTYITKEQNELFQKILETPLQKEKPKEDMDMEDIINATEQLKSYNEDGTKK